MMRSTLYTIPTLFVWAVVLLVLAGCEMQTRVVSNSWTDNFAEHADPKPSDQAATSTRGRRGHSSQSYAVQLQRFTGPQATAMAVDLVGRVREQAGLGDIWYAEAGGTSTVYAGRYRDPQADRARAMLQLVRAAQVDGSRLFTRAQVVPLSGSSADAAVYNERDLRNHRGMITLQIGFYDANYGASFRAAAETAVDVLREQGEDAYFYHGPNRSLITVELFTRGQALVPSGQTEQYSPTVRLLQERFPHNLMNGLTFERRENGVGGVQGSFLVPVR